MRCEKYEEPEMEVTCFELKNIICESPGSGMPDGTGGDGGSTDGEDGGGWNS